MSASESSLSSMITERKVCEKLVRAVTRSQLDCLLVEGERGSMPLLFTVIMCLSLKHCVCVCYGTVVWR